VSVKNANRLARSRFKRQRFFPFRTVRRRRRAVGLRSGGCAPARPWELLLRSYSSSRVFAWRHLLDFRFAPRIRDLPDRRICIESINQSANIAPGLPFQYSPYRPRSTTPVRQREAGRLQSNRDCAIHWLTEYCCTRTNTSLTLSIPPKSVRSLAPRSSRFLFSTNVFYSLPFSFKSFTQITAMKVRAVSLI
jgi:hypothetical protein